MTSTWIVTLKLLVLQWLLAFSSFFWTYFTHESLISRTHRRFCRRRRRCVAVFVTTTTVVVAAVFVVVAVAAAVVIDVLLRSDLCIL